MKIVVVWSLGASAEWAGNLRFSCLKRSILDEMWVIARRKEALEALRDSVHCPVRPIAMDLLNPESFQRYADLLDMAQPEVKVLVNCAGFTASLAGTIRSPFRTA
ncbi:MAG: hypothetical protein ACLVHV_09755 [Oscillospiraceae bacterium]